MRSALGALRPLGTASLALLLLLLIALQPLGADAALGMSCQISITIPEEEPLGTLVTTMTASGGTPPYTFNFVASNYLAPISPDGFYNISSTGAMRVHNRIDADLYPQGLTVRYLVRATDSVGTTGTCYSIISVDNINDNPPTCLDAQNIFTVAENAPNDQSLGSVAIEDPDTGSAISFSLLNSTAPTGMFQFSSNVVKLHDNSMLDYDTEPYSYTLFVRVDDGGFQAACPVQILITNVNDEPPTFLDGPYSFHVLESASIYELVGIVNASGGGRDSPPSNYAVVGSSSFTITPTGRLQVMTPLDADVLTGPLEFMVVALDGPFNASTNVTVFVDDVNDIAPFFDNPSPYLVQLPEDTANGTTVLIFNVSNPDITPAFQEFTLQLLTASPFFELDLSAEPSLKLRYAPDYEIPSQRNLSLVVQASDDAGYSLATIIITVLDANDNAPQLTSQLDFFVNEGENIGFEVAQLTASDRDSGLAGQVQFIQDSPLSGYFNVTPDGRVLVAQQLSFFQDPVVSVSVYPEDLGSPPLRGPTSFLNISVIELITNDAAPTFDNGPFSVTIPEDVTPNEPIIRINVTDMDPAHGNGPFLFELVSAPAFVQLQPVAERSVDVVMTRQVDVDPPGAIVFYSFGIRVSDNHPYNPLTRVAIFNLTIVDANDNAPQILDEYEIFVFENMTSGVELITIIPSDADRDPVNQGFFLVTVGDTFTSDLQTGVISLAPGMALDAEAAFPPAGTQVSVVGFNTPFVYGERQTFFTIYCLPFDPVNGTFPRDNAIVRVNVLDSNDETPVFTNPIAFLTLREGQDFSQGFSATDADITSPNNVIDYAIDSASDDIFELVGQVVQNSMEIDAEAHGLQLRVTIRATDRGFPTLATCFDLGADCYFTSPDFELIVTVTDVNDNAPAIDAIDYVPAFENLTLGSTLVDFTLSDADVTSPNNKMALSISDDSGLFRVEGTRILLNGTLDYETQQSYNPPLSVSTVITINVLDVNDNAPFLVFDSLLDYVYENDPAGTQLGVVNVSDLDSGVNAMVTLSTATSPSHASAVYNNTAVVLVDGHTLTVGDLALNVTGTDHGSPPLATTLHHEALVLDVNNHCPVVTSPLDVTVHANAISDHLVTIVQATDDDIGANSNLSFEALGGNATAFVNISASSGAVTVRVSDFCALANEVLVLESVKSGVIASTPTFSPQSTHEVLVGAIVQLQLPWTHSRAAQDCAAYPHPAR
ncbi:uncharacterized protein MONBRDRAFT_27265 [Monosiga brevicollis MX1]|uniref:Cadherin domain-containing protein n=1 Tax=Monosiga brevicollis TaxID=81824 RepID=A9V4T0_MONBE|nr:uncharacterized protein MONBRDRAFT_27265 [Monosiga brevicollis MX1]EDQ87508.1 predicted protein [Monosiga brevicollis MX1]|eukprot:XP_001747768.1 hypothetical protein [Monosiga brevicollis MX1]